ncbi:hypothetical protein SAMN06272771_3893 [Streptomyces sp. Ag82_O1-12]|uniref:hypothetical protein n=1 Tax=unclassified Streptomyces TaxID=2593676 RepID=UPI000BDB170A|nr:MULTISPECIES: hypothetical protein [unclassified Streptomyces]SMQ17477.1 hypothetical protein SAMN06272771_3893 [Streptomyces sp. Ag82_O1-12]SOD46512.1 hypothetical protein SAMN06272727_3892 [Streptomyces sp. Ag82_G6-1]
MSNSPRPLKSIATAPTGLRAARPAAPRTAVGEPKGAARKGVVTALPCSNRLPATEMQPDADPTPDRPGIRIYAPPVYRHPYDGARWSKRYGNTPTAAYACTCGQTGTATAPSAVAALVTEYDAHKSACTGKPAASLEGRAAA